MFAFKILKDYQSDPSSKYYDPAYDRNGREYRDKELITDPDAESRIFYMYDDDGILYYKGRAYWKYDDTYNWDGDGPIEEDAMDLFDWGARDAGTVLLKFHGKPGWNIG